MFKEQDSFESRRLANGVADILRRDNIFTSLDEVLQYCTVGSYKNMPYRLYFHKLHPFELKHASFDLEFPSGDKFNRVSIIQNCVLDFNIGKKGWAEINRRNRKTKDEYKAKKKEYYANFDKN